MKNSAPEPRSHPGTRNSTVVNSGKRQNSRCLGQVYGKCTDWEHCPYCSELEQALRAIPADVVDF